MLDRETQQVLQQAKLLDRTGSINSASTTVHGKLGQSACRSAAHASRDRRELQLLNAATLRREQSNAAHGHWLMSAGAFGDSLQQQRCPKRNSTVTLHGKSSHTLSRKQQLARHLQLLTEPRNPHRLNSTHCSTQRGSNAGGAVGAQINTVREQHVRYEQRWIQIAWLLKAANKGQQDDQQSSAADFVLAYAEALRVAAAEVQIEASLLGSVYCNCVICDGRSYSLTNSCHWCLPFHNSSFYRMLTLRA